MRARAPCVPAPRLQGSGVLGFDFCRCFLEHAEGLHLVERQPCRADAGVIERDRLLVHPRVRPPHLALRVANVGDFLRLDLVGDIDVLGGVGQIRPGQHRGVGGVSHAVAPPSCCFARWLRASSIRAG